MTAEATLIHAMDPDASTTPSLPPRVPTVDSTPEPPPPDINTQLPSRANTSPDRVFTQLLQQAHPSMRRFRSDSHLRDSARQTSQPPSFHGTFSRRTSQDPALSPLYIPKALPSIAMDILPGIPPTPDSIARPLCDPLVKLCPDCSTPQPVVVAGQSTTVCPSCLTAFKLCEKHSQRRGSVLTSFPPLLTESSTLSEGDTEDQDGGEGGERSRKSSLVETIGRVIGMLRGGVTERVQGGKSESRRGSESSLESWAGDRSGRSTPARPESVLSTRTSSMT